MVEPLNYPFKKHPDTSKDGKMHTNNFFQYSSWRTNNK